MKKNIWVNTAALVLILLFVIIKPIRTENVLKGIAENELDDVKMSDSLRMQLSGPIVSDKEEYMEFKWYKMLEWGDTAAIYIDVYKRPSSFSWRDNFFWPRTTMNHQWNYFLFPNGTSEFTDILPEQTKKIEDSSPTFKFYKTKSVSSDSINMIIGADRLFFFLQNGYFTVREKYKDYTVVDFYEPIAKIVRRNANDTISTMSAKVSVKDSSEVVITPFDVPSEIRSKNNLAD